MALDNSTFLDSVLQPVTAFLEEALGQMGSNRILSQTAHPLIQAIEAVPGAGRVAVFVQTHTSEGPSFVSGPSFAPSEVDALMRIVGQTSDQDALDGSFDAEVKINGGRTNKVRLFPLRVPGEQPKAFLVTVRDKIDDDKSSVFDAFMDQIVQLAGVVVEDRRLRSKMAAQQSVLEALVSAAPDAIIRVDRGGTILDFMGAATRIFGWARDEIVGKPLSLLMPEPYASRHGTYVDAFLKTGERKLPDFGRRLQARHKTGTIFPIEVALSQLPGQEDSEFIGIVRDISRRVATERELDALREDLDAAGRQSALGELAATIAHELNQPLTAIANYMDALELRLATPSDANIKAAGDIAKKTAAQARLGGEIVRRTRRMALTGETEPQMDDFHTAVAEALSIVSKTPAATGVKIYLHQSGASDPVLIDRVQIQQVVTNLVSNAFRAMAESELRELAITTRQTEDQLELIVRDTGPGVPDTEKAKIFDRFFHRSESGMGLGLAIVRRIAVAHGGEIKVADAPSGGAKFTLTLPRRVI